MEHSFDIDVAKEIGVNGAILLKHLYFWVRKNEANNKSFVDGHYWTYNSVKAFNELFPYLSERQIKNALDRLEADGYILTGNYNKSAYDRTKWYAVTKKGKSILLKGKMENTETSNGNAQKVEPIPDINTDTKTNNKTNDSAEQSSSIPYLDIIQYFNTKAGTKYKSSSKDSMKHIKARWKEGYTLEDFFSVIDVKVAEWKDNVKMAPYLRPSTLFGTKFESYLQQAKASPVKKSSPAVSVVTNKDDKVRNTDGSYKTF